MEIFSFQKHRDGRDLETLVRGYSRPLHLIDLTT